MSFLSLLKSVVLTGVDALNAAVGGPQRFDRATAVDPFTSFPSDTARRDAIAARAEAELESFVRGGAFVAQRPNDLGDACIWQGVYTAMATLRWHSTPTDSNRLAMQVAAISLSRYFYPTRPGEAILVRGALPLSLEHDLFHVDHANASRYFTDGYLGPAYVFREDASLDSLLGAMFGIAIVNRFGDEASKEALAGPLRLFSKGFAAAGFRLTNRDGSRTTHGDCAPGFVQAPVRTLAAALPSLLADTDEWRAIARAHAPEFATTDTQVPGRMSWVNAHLAMLASLTFVAAAPKDAPGLSQAVQGLRTLMSKYEDAGNSFLIHACTLIGVQPTRGQTEKADKVLIEFPLGPKPKAGLNSSVAPSLQPVPVWQRPPSDVIWQRSPYPYSGSESHDYTRLDYLVAHYLDRASKAIKEQK